ncbi:twin-arginine translocation signal domain-containing protein, partial [uncultured Cobetia sp.]
MANQSRRNFMRNSLLGLAALPLGAAILSPRALAADL